MKYDYDVLVIGAGHAGVEAALATARAGHKTAIMTLDKNKIALMPCNPSIGGSAKGIVVREIDALGGEMAKAADATALQMKLLNNSRGPAVWAMRAQSDKIAYSEYMKNVLEKQENLTIIETLVQELLVSDEQEVFGVRCEDKQTFLSRVVILTTGTYMRSLTLQGFTKKSEGPDQQRTSNGISLQLANLGFQLVRLKTGTPPRLLASSIDFSQTQLELGTNLPLAFSHQTKKFLSFEEQWPCYLLYTNEKTHEIINNNLDKSPMYNGTIDSKGPRYCPSIEDKVVRFADKPRHQIFLEPESKELDTIYVQGLSTSLGIEEQDQILRTLPGLVNCQVVKWAYAIEYDAIEPTQLWPTLETKLIKNFFTAGQINGTSGYEEAACQGLMAGINAHLKLTKQKPLILKRDEAYIGVLIDDLTTKGNSSEPYRLLTSLAEHRLLLRNDNAQTRLIKYGYQAGLVSQIQWDEFNHKQELMKVIEDKLKMIKVKPNTEFADLLIKNHQMTIPENSISCYELLKRPEIKLACFKPLIIEISQLDDHQILELEISIKFIGYINQQIKVAQQMLSLESKQIPSDINYDLVDNITLAAKEKLKKIRPLTIAHATRISGISPADIQMLLFFLKNKYPYLNAN
ncbi:tRNA uridine-5-carboxymethylaminomethyl(34) synthesis enzyme MnmG [Spiroplasma platyhelix]|uniref:tRNA uridine 5-carboxymethylaminomethyl modification enzyme MnmG n=1 Tax=Spiroplasma platyhelix PALS-1 TaxID=1276218 RepID=A0A846TX29_9MOLU|nr:tRNA uridine-5-carboxymethylaminomethyl(34) synthesis enzyme MnmG [Spiroplasma platyhelix]MBE4704238.1 tRNA uridine 5-carboxymethylaminomethyl modification enzyme MnmG [Spiroplasma platyhelix PALS-1]NKE38611.1 tRNA uridine-5-carboxymethylaminomethyl(34) synthesis enzyme MnmG [Spiroplasma platyhelix PALS-1]UJB28822.1 tRNA uridine 5-carboxymethylaminomethyl modification protein GidA [Spiroplasma platyhelix PALS-1]